MSTRLRLVEPRNENRSVPIRPTNFKLFTREYMTAPEVDKLIKAARDGRYGHRDATLILVAIRHGLRAVEICDLEWSKVEFDRSASVRRAKNGKPSVHPLSSAGGSSRRTDDSWAIVSAACDVRGTRIPQDRSNLKTFALDRRRCKG
jgi:integrase